MFEPKETNVVNEMPGMPTDMCDEETKGKLDKLTKGKTSQQLRHMGNHLHNHADKLRKHAEDTVTMDDFHKAMKRNNES